MVGGNSPHPHDLRGTGEVASRALALRMPHGSVPDLVWAVTGWGARHGSANAGLLAESPLDTRVQWVPGTMGKQTSKTLSETRKETARISVLQTSVSLGNWILLVNLGG